MLCRHLLEIFVSTEMRAGDPSCYDDITMDLVIKHPDIRVFPSSNFKSPTNVKYGRKQLLSYVTCVLSSKHTYALSNYLQNER